MYEIFDLKNFVSLVCWAIDLRSSLYIIELPHSYRGMKPHRNIFSFAVILHSLLNKQQTCLVSSTHEVTTGREFTIEHTHHSIDCSIRGIECNFSINNCLLTPLIVPVYAKCLIECLFFTYECQKMLMIFFWCY